MATQLQPAPEIKSAQDAELDPFNRILVVGPTGSGKSALTWTLPGRKFIYVFDPNTLPTLKGCPEADYVPFMPEFTELDATLKGFNKGAKSDRPASAKEPTLYLRWVEHINDMVARGVFNNYEWLVFDSMTFVVKAMMDRQLFINGRYGHIEDIADYRVTGSKLADIFQTITSLKMNIYSTGHFSTYQDEKTKVISTNINLPGRSRTVLPLIHSNVWKSQSIDDGKRQRYQVRTVPENSGLKEIRTALKGLKNIEDVTIEDFRNPTKYGIAALIERSEKHAIHQ